MHRRRMMMTSVEEEAASIVWEGTETYDSSAITLDNVSIVADSTDEGTYVMTRTSSTASGGYVTLPGTGQTSGTFEIIYKTDSSLDINHRNDTTWDFGMVDSVVSGYRSGAIIKFGSTSTPSMYYIGSNNAAKLIATRPTDTWETWTMTVDAENETSTLEYGVNSRQTMVLPNGSSTAQDCCTLWFACNNVVVKSIKWIPAKS